MFFSPLARGNIEEQLVNNGAGKGFLHDSTMPLSKSMLNSIQLKLQYSPELGADINHHNVLEILICHITTTSLSGLSVNILELELEWFGT